MWCARRCAPRSARCRLERERLGEEGLDGEVAFGGDVVELRQGSGDRAHARSPFKKEMAGKGLPALSERAAGTATRRSVAARGAVLAQPTARPRGARRHPQWLGRAEAPAPVACSGRGLLGRGAVILKSRHAMADGDGARVEYVARGFRARLRRSELRRPARLHALPPRGRLAWLLQVGIRAAHELPRCRSVHTRVRRACQRFSDAAPCGGLRVQDPLLAQ